MREEEFSQELAKAVERWIKKCKTYETNFSPCGHHTSKLKRIGKFRGREVWRCECGKLYLDAGGFPIDISEMKGIIKEIE